MLCGCGHAFVVVYLEARHHLVKKVVGVVKAEFINHLLFLGVQGEHRRSRA